MRYLIAISLILVMVSSGCIGQSGQSSEASYRSDIGNTLITYNDESSQVVVELDKNNKVVWEYRKIKGKYDRFDYAQRLSNGNTILVDSDEVIEVDKSKNIIWSVDSDLGELYVFRSAQRLSNGNTLITGVSDIIEIDKNKNIVWQYGHKEGSSLRSVKLSNDNILAVDYYGQYVFEVDMNKKIVWQYGIQWKNKTSGGYLTNPVNIARLDNGNTLISDHDGITEINREGNIIWKYNEYVSGFQALKNGNILINNLVYASEITRDKKEVWLYDPEELIEYAYRIGGSVSEINKSKGNVSFDYPAGWEKKSDLPIASFTRGKEVLTIMRIPLETGFDKWKSAALGGKEATYKNFTLLESKQIKGEKFDITIDIITYSGIWNSDKFKGKDAWIYYNGNVYNIVYLATENYFDGSVVESVAKSFNVNG